MVELAWRGWAWTLPAAGCGIWATHFIAMLAYDPGTSAGYDPGLTAASLIIAVAITGVGLSIALSNSSRWSGPIGGAVIGGGIAAMHFTGMMALEVPGHISWSVELVLASLSWVSCLEAWRFSWPRGVTLDGITGLPPAP